MKKYLVCSLLSLIFLLHLAWAGPSILVGIPSTVSVGASGESVPLQIVVHAGGFTNLREINILIDGSVKYSQSVSGSSATVVYLTSFTPGYFDTGEHELTAVVESSLGVDTKTVTFTFDPNASDCVAPSISISAPRYVKAGKPITFEYTVVDTGTGVAWSTAEIYANGSLLNPSCEPVQLSSTTRKYICTCCDGSSKGDYLVRVYAWDGKFNYAAKEITVHVVGDSTPPTVSIESHKLRYAGGTYVLDLNVKYSDNIGVDRLVVDCGDGETKSVDVDGNGTATVSCAYSDSAGETKNVSVWAVDYVGNKSNPATLSVLLDVAPQIEDFHLEGPGVKSRSGDEYVVEEGREFNVCFRIYDPDSKMDANLIRLYYYGIPGKMPDKHWDFTNVGPGTVERCVTDKIPSASVDPRWYRLQVTDGYFSASREITVKVPPPPPPPPNRPPVIDKFDVPSSAVAGEPFTVHFAAHDPDGRIVEATIYLDDTVAWKKTYSSSSVEDDATITIANPGTYTLKLVVYDNSSAKAGKTAQISVSQSGNPPVVEITCPQSVYVGVQYGIEAYASDADGISTVKIYRNGQLWHSEDAGGVTAYQKIFYDQAQEVGSVEYNLVVMDTTGAAAWDACTVDIVSPSPPADTTPPSVSIAVEGGPFVAPADVPVEINASDNSSLQRIVVNCGNGTSQTIYPDANPYQTTYTCHYDDPGEYTIVVTAYDAADNSGSDSAEVIVNSLPIIVKAEINVPGSVTEWESFDVNVYAYASAGLREVNVYRNNDLILNYTDGGAEFSTQISQALPAGTYTYKVVAADMQGHVAEDTGTITVTAAEANEINVQIYELILTPVSGTVARVYVEGKENGEYVDLTCADITYSVNPIDNVGISSYSCNDVTRDGHGAAEIVITGAGRYQVTVSWHDITKTVAVVVLRAVSSAGVPIYVAIVLALLVFAIPLWSFR